MMKPIENVPGLYICENVIKKREQQEILKNLIHTEGSKLSHVHNNATEFGWKFLNKKNGYNGVYTKDDFIGYPQWLKELWLKIIERTDIEDLIKNAKIPENELLNDIYLYDNMPYIKLVDNKNNNTNFTLKDFDHAIMNLYEKDRINFLAKHVDSYRTWTNWVVGLSMGSDVYFDFERNGKIEKVFVPKYSVYLMINDARYNYSHAIPQQEFNMVKRVSLTFRNINEQILPKNIKDSIEII